MSQFGALAGSISRDRKKAIGIGTLAVLVLLIATAFALGGSGGHKTPNRGVAVPLPASPPTASQGGLPKAEHRTAALPPTVNAPAEPEVAPSTVTEPQAADSVTVGSTGSAAGSGTVAAGPTQSVIQSVAPSGVTATRIVKTGDLQLRVTKGAVQSTMAKLGALATSHGGYVAESNTDANPTSPSGDITLRVPVGQFTATVTEAEKFGHVDSLSTEAKDVTGKYVDLNARLHALQRTRATYLSILSRATTIGATLSVQQRIDDVQQQIDELKGEIKLLASQSSYSTLDVHVDQPALIAVVKPHHERHGLSKAWHTSIHRFTRGIDAIVAAVGPLLLGILIIAFGYAVIRLGSRSYRRHRSSGAAT